MARVSLDGALFHEVCVFNLPTLPKVWPFMVQCLFMHCSTHGWPLRKRCAQRLCKVLPTKKTNILSCTLCDIVSCLYFFSCRKNNFQVQVQVQIKPVDSLYGIFENIKHATNRWIGERNNLVQCVVLHALFGRPWVLSISCLMIILVPVILHFTRNEITYPFWLLWWPSTAFVYGSI